MQGENYIKTVEIKELGHCTKYIKIYFVISNFWK